jgi:hypothetical protein
LPAKQFCILAAANVIKPRFVKDRPKKKTPRVISDFHSGFSFKRYLPLSFKITQTVGRGGEGRGKVVGDGEGSGGAGRGGGVEE